MDAARKRTWAEISLGNLEHNYRTLRGLLPDGCRFLGVVKAGGYGHGAVAVAKRLEELGADYLAVACVDEAAQLREAGIAAPILILGATDPAWAGELLELDITQTVFDLETARRFSDAAQAAGKKLKVHVKADTGMSRLGFLCTQEALERSAEEIGALCALPGLEAEGIFTHFADADGSQEYTMLQFGRFTDLLAALERRGVTFAIRHCANAAAVLNYPCTYLDMVRPGLALYGHYPDPMGPDMVRSDRPGRGKVVLRPVMTFKTRIAALRDLDAGTAVSYGCTRVLDRPSRVAILSVGYADGFSRRLSNRGKVLIRGARCPIVGRVCMDMCMADVTDLPDAAVGDEVILWGEELPV